MRAAAAIDAIRWKIESVNREGRMEERETLLA